MDSQSPQVRTLAFFIGGSNRGGDIYDNKITSNVTPVWIGNDYGSASNVEFRGNTVSRAEGAPEFVPFKLGDGGNTATKIHFKDNKFLRCAFGVDGAGEYTGP